jgi:hypothetical protein
MCTTIGHKATVCGSAKGLQGWFAVDRAYVGYDHPTHARLEHALSLDFVNEASGSGERVAVELSRVSARTLAAAMLRALDEADEYEGWSGEHTAKVTGRPRLSTTT